MLAHQPAVTTQQGSWTNQQDQPLFSAALWYPSSAMQGILDQQGRRVLSKLIYCLFTPALTFTKLAPVLSGPHLLLWLPLVVNMFVSVGVGLLLGVLLLLVVRPPAGLRKHVVVAAGLGNAGNLPLVLVAALIRETGGKLFAGEVSQRLLQLRG